MPQYLKRLPKLLPDVIRAIKADLCDTDDTLQQIAKRHGSSLSMVWSILHQPRFGFVPWPNCGYERRLKGRLLRQRKPSTSAEIIEKIKNDLCNTGDSLAVIAARYGKSQTLVWMVLHEPRFDIVPWPNDGYQWRLTSLSQAS